MAVLSDKQREAGWTIAKLGDVVTCLDHLRQPIKGLDRVPGPYPYYGASGVVDYIDQYAIDGKYLLISEDGENLRSRSLPIAFYAVGKSWVNNHAHIISASDSVMAYVKYVLNSHDVSAYLTGTTMPKLSQKSMMLIDIPLPPQDILERIAGILGSLDDKIEANTRLIQTLSDYCVALVDSLKLFEGSRESTLGEIIEFSPKVKKPVGEEYQFIDMSSLPTMGPVPETISSKSSWSGAKFENGDTLFARITPCLENGKTAIAMGLGDEPACGSTEFIVMRANTPAQVILPYGIARSDKFRQEAMSHMIGSTGRQRVKWQDLANIPVSVPSESDMQKIEKLSDIFGYFETLRKENLQLAETRDALIKRLIG